VGHGRFLLHCFVFNTYPTIRSFSVRDIDSVSKQEIKKYINMKTSASREIGHWDASVWLFPSYVYEAWHWRFGAPWVRTAWTECYWPFLRPSFAEEAARQVAGRDSGFCITITHRAIHRLLYHHPTTVLSRSRSEWLSAVPYSENGPRGDTFRNHGGHHVECDGRTPEDSQRSLRPVFPTMGGSM
jgi:hypothetical protein